jgi:hypothetical protein
MAGGPTMTRSFSRRRELAVQDQERNATEVIAMEVANDDCVDLVGFDAECLHGHETRGTAINEQMRTGGLQLHARLEPTAVAERVT